MMADWTQDCGIARGWLARTAVRMGWSHEIKIASDGAPLLLVRLAHPIGVTFEASAALCRQTLRLVVRDALGRPPGEVERESIETSWRRPEVVRLYPSPHGPALDISFGIPVLAPTTELRLDDAFMMIGDAAARVRCGESSNDPATTDIDDEAVESAANVLQDPSFGIGADGRGAVQTRAGNAANLSIAKTNGAMLIYAATELVNIANGAALDAAVLYVNQAAPAGSLAR